MLSTSLELDNNSLNSTGLPVFANLQQTWNEYRVGADAEFAGFRFTVLRRWLQAVDSLTDAVNSTRSLRTILDLVADKARELLGFDFCAVLLPDPQRLNLVITGWSGLSAEYVARVNADRPVRLTADDAVQAPSSKAFKTTRPVSVADIATEPEFTPWGGVAREQGYHLAGKDNQPVCHLSMPLYSGCDYHPDRLEAPA